MNVVDPPMEPTSADTELPLERIIAFLQEFDLTFQTPGETEDANNLTEEAKELLLHVERDSGNPTLLVIHDGSAIAHAMCDLFHSALYITQSKFAELRLPHTVTRLSEVATEWRDAALRRLHRTLHVIDLSPHNKVRIICDDIAARALLTELCRSNNNDHQLELLEQDPIPPGYVINRATNGKLAFTFEQE